MAYEPLRAQAFGHYVLPILLAKQGSKKMLKIDRPRLAKILGVQKLWDNHTDDVWEAAVEEGIGIADFGSFFLFFKSDDFSSETVSEQETRKITNKYVDLYNSKAADEEFEKDMP